MTNRNRKFVLFSISRIGLVLLLCSTTIFANPDFSGGDGTAESPWQISNAAELDALRNYLGSGHADKHFVLTADIDLWGFGGEEGWQSIGTFGASSGFGGTFDGNGFVIRNLTINRPAEFYQGLFGRTVSTSTIRDLGLESVQIIGSRWTGGLVGRATGSLIDGVSVSGRIEGGEDVGGLVGGIETTSTIHRSRTQVEVFGNNRVGGLVGSVATVGDLVTQSYSLGQVTSSGGEVGKHGCWLADDHQRPKWQWPRSTAVFGCRECDRASQDRNDSHHRSLGPAIDHDRSPGGDDSVSGKDAGIR